MKFLKRILASFAVGLFLFSSSTQFSGCTKEIIRDTIIKKDTIRIIDSVCYDLTDSLIAWYKFTGGSLKDSSGKNNHIVFNNATATADRFGRANNAYSFNGNSSYMRVANSNTINSPNKISMMAIVRFNDFYRGSCHGNQIFMKGLRDQSNGIYGLRVLTLQDCSLTTDTTLERATGFYGNTQSFQIGATDMTNRVQANKWINIIFTFDGSTAKIYVDGVLKSTTTGNPSFTANTDDLYIGRAEFSAFPYWFNGTMDEIRIYNKALCDGEVRALNKLRD
jgi:Concanavalin A-like lectin/glucanases superfamily